MHHSTLTRAANKIVDGKDPVTKVPRETETTCCTNAAKRTRTAYRPVNRDRSAATNMRTLYLHWKSTLGSRHATFSRQVALAALIVVHRKSLAIIPPPNMRCENHVSAEAGWISESETNSSEREGCFCSDPEASDRHLNDKAPIFLIFFAIG